MTVYVVYFKETGNLDRIFPTMEMAQDYVSQITNCINHLSDCNLPHNIAQRSQLITPIEIETSANIRLCIIME